MDSVDWRTQLPPGSRHKIVNEIMETLRKHLPFSGAEEINELRRLAARLEDKIFSDAINQTDYLRKISARILTMEMKSQNAAGSSSSILASNNSIPLDLCDAISRPSLPNGEPTRNIDYWRTQLPPDSRQKNVNTILETLKKHVSNSSQEGINELMRISVSFEELIFNSAIKQVDYFRKISFKMQTTEEEGEVNLVRSGLLHLNISGSSYYTSMAPSFPSGEPTMEAAAASDWRTQLSSHARSRIINKIMETLKNHLPFSGPEGLTELRRIATRFEENVFSAASGQTDYLRKISTKMFAMETKSQNAAGSSSAANNGTSMNSGDWRAQLPPVSRQQNVEKIREALNKHVPNCGQEGINELTRIAASFEELIFNTAINQVDYIRKVSFKLQTGRGRLTQR
ncbi:unnamed protein product [Arabis nemorensis]|uniref:Mediator complex subunit 15 KIX domain-containing protein n=1 Tax=Arabis nemorensis TaxID=586526 RepID=A0A565ARF2_9BRAS|nr:unnamed protein product [Arabis nemorensis]